MTEQRPLFDPVARLAQVLSSAERLVLLELLTQGERSVDVLAKRAGQTVQTTSHHLQKLVAAGLASRRREGRRVMYAVGDPSVAGFWCGLRAFTEAHSSELREAFSELAAQRGDVVDFDRLELLLKRRAVTLLDVRPEEEYRAAHLPTAWSIPFDQLEARWQELPENRPVVVYCRGRYCLLADRAVELIRSHGVQASRLENGVVEWRARGGNVERGQHESKGPRARRTISNAE